MKSLLRSVAAFLLLSSALTPPSFAEKHWIEVRTAHFSVVSDVGEKRASEIAHRCEQVRAVFSILMDRPATNDPAPLAIFALDGNKEVAELGGSADRKSRHAGLFLARADENFILIDASGNPWPAIFHEYTHELLNANTSSNVQAWFDEGFAEYLSTFASNQGRAEIGKVPLGKLQFLRSNGKLLRLADLIRVSRNSDIYNLGGPMQQVFYAQSWLLVHYLFDYQLIGRAQPFFDFMAGGMSLEEASRKAFSVSSAKLEDDLLAYAKAERFRSFSLAVNGDDFSESETATILSDATAAALKAELRWHEKVVHSDDQIAQYAAEFKSVLSHEPANTIALRGIGLALLERKDYDGASIYLHQAINSNPQDAGSHRALSILLGALEAAGRANSGSNSSYSEAEICAHLSPGFADSYRLMGFSLMRQGEFDQAEIMMTKAVTLSPRNEVYKLNLADIELKKQEYAPALALLQELKNSDNPEIARQAEYFLATNVEKK